VKAEDYADLYSLEESFWWFLGMREITASMLDPLCPPSQDRVILDAGCGTGGMLSWLARYAGRGEVFGIDIAPEALRFCRERGHKRLAQASVESLPFDDSIFDLVTSFDVLVQLPGEGSDLSALREMHRVLRPDGFVFVRVAAFEWMRSGHDAALNSQRRYTLGQLTEKMRSAGFDILRASYANSILFPVAVLRRLLLKRLGLAETGSDVKPLPPSFSWLNRALTWALLSEARLLKLTAVSLPTGLSIICVAKKSRE
jgi:SAM-dependent methyltransferase